MGRAGRSLVHKLIRAADSRLFEVPKGWHVFSRQGHSHAFGATPPVHRLRCIAVIGHVNGSSFVHRACAGTGQLSCF